MLLHYLLSNIIVISCTKGELKSRGEGSSWLGVHRSSKPRCLWALQWVNTALSVIDVKKVCYVFYFYFWKVFYFPVANLFIVLNPLKSEIKRLLSHLFNTAAKPIRNSLAKCRDSQTHAHQDSNFSRELNNFVYLSATIFTGIE